MMITNRKLVKKDDDNYYFLIDGNQVTKGPICWVKAAIKKYGIKDIDFAVDQMNQNGHTVADFGIMGSLILTQSFEEAQLGLNSTEQQEAQ